MNGNGQADAPWGYAIEGKPAVMLHAALRSLGREGPNPQPLPACNGEPCSWVRRVAECLHSGHCRTIVLFCEDPGLACCIANKVPGVRAAAVWTITQGERAVDQLGANLLVVEMAGRTYYEFRELLRLCCTRMPAACPPEVACVLQELDGHAHR
jgi:hypothetical protein